MVFEEVKKKMKPKDGIEPPISTFQLGFGSELNQDNQPIILCLLFTCWWDRSGKVLSEWSVQISLPCWKETVTNSEPREIMITVSICRCRRYRPLGRMSWLDA